MIVGRRADPRPLGQRQQPVDRDRPVRRTERDDPAADAAAVQRDSNHRADGDAGAQRFGDEVVELLVEPGDVGNDSSDEQRRRVHCPATLEDYRPTALLKSSSRLTASQVNSGSARPK